MYRRLSIRISLALLTHCPQPIVVSVASRQLIVKLLITSYHWRRWACSSTNHDVSSINHRPHGKTSSFLTLLPSFSLADHWPVSSAPFMNWTLLTLGSSRSNKCYLFIHLWQFIIVSIAHASSIIYINIKTVIGNPSRSCVSWNEHRPCRAFTIIRPITFNRSSSMMKFCWACLPIIIYMARASSIMHMDNRTVNPSLSLTDHHPLPSASFMKWASLSLLSTPHLPRWNTRVAGPIQPSVPMYHYLDSLCFKAIITLCHL